MNGTTRNPMTDQQQQSTRSDTHETMAQPLSSRYYLPALPSRKRSNPSPVSTGDTSSTTDTNNQVNDHNHAMHSHMKRQRRKVTNFSISTRDVSTTMMIDSVENEPAQMKRMDADDMSDGPTIQVAPVFVHSTVSHILRLDQTAQRLCAQMLERKEIIAFGRSCHAIYSTLNHPLTWAHTRPYPMENLLPDLSSRSIVPFLRHAPVTWKISACDTDAAPRLTELVSQLEQSPPRYRLTGLTIQPTNDDDKNKALSHLVLQLLQNPLLVLHLSTIFLMSFVVWPNTAEDRFFMPNCLLVAILQLPRLDSLHLLLRELTPELVNQFVQVQPRLSQLKLCLTTRCTPEEIAPLVNAPLCHGLVSLTLGGINSERERTSDYLIHLTQIRTLHLISRFTYLPLIPTLAKMPSLRHLYITHVIEDEANPPFIHFIQELDTSVPQLDTISIQLGTHSPFVCSIDQSPIFHELQQYVHRRHGPSQPHSPSHRLFVRVCKVRPFGRLFPLNLRII